MMALIEGDEGFEDVCMRKGKK